jgi:hypothetical protein
MRVRTADPEAYRLAEYKLQVIRQQELVANLVRQGQHDPARQARAKLMQLLFKLDCLEAIAG